MSSKVISYYDWSIQFNSHHTSPGYAKIVTSGCDTSAKNLNSIGIADDDFKNYLRKWKNRNLS